MVRSVFGWDFSIVSEISDRTGHGAARRRGGHRITLRIEGVMIVSFLGTAMTVEDLRRGPELPRQALRVHVVAGMEQAGAQTEALPRAPVLHEAGHCEWILRLAIRGFVTCSAVRTSLPFVQRPIPFLPPAWTTTLPTSPDPVSTPPLSTVTCPRTWPSTINVPDTDTSPAIDPVTCRRAPLPT